MTNELTLTPEYKRLLLSIARKSISDCLNGKGKNADASEDVPKELLISCGAFVSLHQNGSLRGCIGRFDAEEPVIRVVQEMAIAASTQDPRFRPVTLPELASIDIEISVLTPMRKIKSADQIEMGKHGIYIKKGFRSGTFLPQVAAETGWSKEEFLGRCSRDKAGIGWDGWKDAELFTYEAIVFGENNLKH